MAEFRVDALDILAMVAADPGAEYAEALLDSDLSDGDDAGDGCAAHGRRLDRGYQPRYGSPDGAKPPHGGSEIDRGDLTEVFRELDGWGKTKTK